MVSESQAAMLGAGQGSVNLGASAPACQIPAWDSEGGGVEVQRLTPLGGPWPGGHMGWAGPLTWAPLLRLPRQAWSSTALGLHPR